MKNLLTFTDPLRRFVKDCEALTKMQIDNSLELGWKKEDIILATNFPYEYQGIKSVIIGTYETYDNNRSTKIMMINDLFRQGIINDDVYWFHDDDAFQLVPFDYVLKKDAAFTTHGVFRPGLWNAGSFFFNKNARDIFISIEEWMQKLGGVNEQGALTHMWQQNYNNINERTEMLDPSYNLGIYKIPENIQISTLPIKVVHFHPHKKHHLDLYRNLLPQRLFTIFSNYGIN